MIDEYKVESQSDKHLYEYRTNDLNLVQKLNSRFDDLFRAVIDPEYSIVGISEAFEQLSLQINKSKSLIPEFIDAPLESGETIFYFFLTFLRNEKWDLQLKLKCITAIDYMLVSVSNSSNKSFFELATDVDFSNIRESFLFVLSSCPLDYPEYPKFICNVTKIFKCLLKQCNGFAPVLYSSPFMSDFIANFHPEIILHFPRDDFSTFLDFLKFLLEIFRYFLIYTETPTLEMIEPLLRIINEYYELPDDFFQSEGINAEEESEYESKVNEIIAKSPQTLGNEFCETLLYIWGNRNEKKDFPIILSQMKIFPLIIDRMIYDYNSPRAMDFISQALIDDLLAPTVKPLINFDKVFENVNRDFQENPIEQEFLDQAFESGVVLIVNYLNSLSEIPKEIQSQTQVLFDFILHIFEQCTFETKKAASFLFLIILSYQDIAALDDFFSDEFAEDLFFAIIEGGNDTISKALDVFKHLLAKACLMPFDLSQSTFLSVSIPQFLEKLIEHPMISDCSDDSDDFVQQAEKLLKDFYGSDESD